MEFEMIENIESAEKRFAEARNVIQKNESARRLESCYGK